MRSCTKCYLYLMIISILLTLFPISVGAATYAQLYAAKAKEKQTQNVIDTNSAKMNKTEGQLLALKNSINELDNSISGDKSNISTGQTRLDILQGQESAAEAERSELIQEYNGMLVYTYESGGSTEYLSWLLNAVSWEDFLTRLDDIKAIMNHNQSLQQQISYQDQLIQGQATQVDQGIADLQTSVNQENQMVALKEQATSSEQIALSGLNSKQRLLEEEKLSQLNTINNIQRELQEQEEEAKMAAEYGPIKSESGIARITQPVTVGSAALSSLLGYAEGYMGTAYVWGGTSPDPGFDCSGFTQYVFRHIGVNLERTSQEQYLEGAPVAENNLQPGDLIFFSTYTSGASHVGISIGNGLMVDAEADGVIIDNITNAYWAPRYLGARRIAQS